MALELTHEIRDPIHGLILLTDQEMRIVNTAAFQRLRRVRQLAMANLVYPGALHSRFEHSLGTLHVAHRILERIARTEQLYDNDVKVVRLAALLHDIGHGPFSHVSEYILDQYYDKTAVGTSAAREKIHEKVTVDIINQIDEISGLLSSEEREGITDIIRESRTRNFRRDIVSSSLDADKMDYLLRDAYFTGVRYGVFDLDKVIEACRTYSRGEESYLVIGEEGVFAVEQLILAKHYMTQQVYSHRVRTITDFMIVRGLELAIEDGYAGVRELFSYDGTESFLERYQQYDDAKLMALILNCDFPRPRTLFERLGERRLFKELALIPLNNSEIGDSITLHRLLTIDNETARHLEELIAAELGCEPWEVIVQKKSIKNPAYESPGGFDPEAIHVIYRDDSPRKLNDYPDLVSAKMPTTERLHVIGPLDSSNDLSRTERQNLQKEWSQRITNLTIQTVGG